MTIQAYYDAEAQRPPTPRTRTLQAWRMSRLAHLIKEPRKRDSWILDIGCGDAFLSASFRYPGSPCKTLAVDLSALRLRHLLTPDRGVQGDATRLPAKDESVDLAFATELLEHLANPDDAIRELARVLRRGGTAMVSVPIHSPAEMATCPHCLKEFPLAGHVTEFSSYGLAYLLNSYGLRPRRVVTMETRAVNWLVNRWPSAPEWAVVLLDFAAKCMGLRPHLAAVLAIKA